MTDSLFKYVSIIGIKDNWIEYENGIKTYFYRPEFDVDTDWVNQSIIEDFIERTSAVLASYPDFYIFNYLIFIKSGIDRIQRTINENAIDEPFVKEFYKNKMDFLKQFKTLSYFFTVTPIYNEKGSVPNMRPLPELVPLQEHEIYNLLFYMLNPDMACDDYDRVPYTVNELANPEVSLSSTLFKSYFTANTNSLKIGDIFCDQHYIINPPSLINSDFTLGPAIYSLAEMKSDSVISIQVRNQSNPIDSKLSNMKSFGAQGILKKVNYLNFAAAKEIAKFEKYTADTGFKALNMSIQLALFNEDFKEMKKEAKTLRQLSGFEGSVFINNKFNKFKDYIAMIPGTSYGYKHTFTYSTRQFSTMLMLPKMDLNSVFIYKKKGNILTTFDLTNTKDTGMPGGLVFASPGRGKSAFLNYNLANLFMTQRDNLELTLIDYGGSYKTLYNALSLENYGGSYTDLEIADGLKFNPFDLEFGEEITESMINEKISVTTAFLVMALNIDDENEDMKNLIEKTLFQMYNDVLYGKSKPKIIEFGGFNNKYFIDKYVEDGMKDFNTFAMAMPTITDFSLSLNRDESVKSSFTPGLIQELNNKITSFTSSTNGKLFNGKSTQNLVGKFMFIDFQNIAQSNVGLLNLIMSYVLTTKILSYSNPKKVGKKKIILIDEYHQFKQRSTTSGGDISNRLDAFLSTIFKTGRKQNIHLYLITQNIEDFNQNFFNACARLICFNPASSKMLNNLSEIVDVPVEELKPLITKVKTVPGDYSEMLIFSNNPTRSKTFLQLKVSLFEYFAFISTTPEERQRKNDLLQQMNNDYLAVIKQMVKEKEENR